MRKFIWPTIGTVLIFSAMMAFDVGFPVAIGASLSIGATLFSIFHAVSGGSYEGMPGALRHQSLMGILLYSALTLVCFLIGLSLVAVGLVGVFGKTMTIEAFAILCGLSLFFVGVGILLRKRAKAIASEK